MDKLPTISVLPKILSTPFFTTTLPFSNKAIFESVAGSTSLPTLKKVATDALVVAVLPVTSRTFEPFASTRKLSLVVLIRLVANKFVETVLP